MITKTRGVTNSDAVNLQTTGIIEGRVDLCTMASLYKFFDLNGVVIGTKSMLLREITETLMTSLEEGGMAERITDLEEASRIMTRLSTNRDKRVFGNLGRAISQQRGQELDREEIKRTAMEWLKNNDPANYERVMRENEKHTQDISGDGPPKVDNTVPDFMSMMPAAVVMDVNK